MAAISTTFLQQKKPEPTVVKPFVKDCGCNGLTTITTVQPSFM